MRKITFILILTGLAVAFGLGFMASGYFGGMPPSALTKHLPSWIKVPESLSPGDGSGELIPSSMERAVTTPAASPPDPDSLEFDDMQDMADQDAEWADSLDYGGLDDDTEIVEDGSFSDFPGSGYSGFPSVANVISVPLSPTLLLETEVVSKTASMGPWVSNDPFPSSVVPSILEVIRVDGPLSFCGEPVPLDVDEVRERLEKELMLNMWDRPQVLLWIKRSGRYMPIIDAKLEAAGLPRDLRYVAIAESALRPHVGSPKGALGFWQFIKSTARRYGLAVNREVDERREIRMSTDAAIRYFQDLYLQFGSWTLSAAAYNMGEKGLESRMLVQEEKDYYHLYLPLETQRYIFRILAAKILMENPERFGFYLEERDYYQPIPVDFVEFSTIAKSPLTLVAKASGASFKRIKDLNPHLRGYDLAAGKHRVMIPQGNAQGFEARFQDLFAVWFEKKAGHIYTVRAGDTLSGIADAHGVPLPTLLIWNRISLKKPIYPGQRLLVYKKSK